MTKYIKFLIIFLLTVTVLDARSQSTTSSPYSRYGIGDLSPSVFPQNMAMGGIGTAINQINGYSTINPLNPASYAAIGLTTIDVGLYGNFNTLTQTGQTSQRDASFRLNHFAFGIPVSRGSAFSFGLMPYSEVGYNYKQTFNRGFGSNAPADTSRAVYSYSGEGGLSKAYLGYGFTIARNFMFGANMSYIFGNMKQYSSAEFPDTYGALNSRDELSYSVGGLTYDYGAQYRIDLSLTRHLIFAYSGSASSAINSQKSHIVSHYRFDAQGNESAASDSLINIKNPKAKIQLPQIHHFGVSYQRDQKFLVGLDYNMGNWSALSIDGVNSGMVDSRTLNLGGQITPNINALNNYWATVDYRLGAILDQSYFKVPNPTGGGQTDIKSYALTFGLGMPLRSVNGQSYYKINLAAELGRRGTIANGLVRENYVKIRIGFTLNDRWFQRYKFD